MGAQIKGTASPKFRDKNQNPSITQFQWKNALIEARSQLKIISILFAMADSKVARDSTWDKLAENEGPENHCLQIWFLPQRHVGFN